MTNIISYIKVNENSLLIEDVLIQMSKIPRRQRNPLENFIVDTLVSKGKNDSVMIVRDVHANDYDINGRFHFNIQVKRGGIVNPTTYHIYVEPYLVDVRDAFIISPNGSVTLKCPQSWRYQYIGVTQ